MSQENVYQWLKKHPTWQTTTKISNAMPELNRSSITMNLLRLRKRQCIEYRRKKKVGKGYIELQYRYIKPIEV